MAEAVKSVIWLIVIVAGILVILAATMPSIGVLKGIGDAISKYVLFGANADSLSQIEGAVGRISALITAFMVWLIIFAGFGDILENFSAFSKGIAWVIAFAVGVVAANVGIIKTGLLALVAAFAWAGTFSIFAALLGAIAAFFVVNWGIRGSLQWIKNRQEMIQAATGRNYASSGLLTLTKTGKIITKEGRSSEPSSTS